MKLAKCPYCGRRMSYSSAFMNKSKGEVAYSMFDIETPVTEEIVKELEAVDGVFRVRVVK